MPEKRKFKIITSEIIEVDLDGIKNMPENDRKVLSGILRSGKANGRDIFKCVIQDPFVGLNNLECSVGIMNLLNDDMIQMEHIDGQNFYVLTNKGRQAIVLIRRHYE